MDHSDTLFKKKQIQNLGVVAYASNVVVIVATKWDAEKKNNSIKNNFPAILSFNFTEKEMNVEKKIEL